MIKDKETDKYPMRIFATLILVSLMTSAHAQRVQKSSCTPIDVREINPKISGNEALKKHFMTPRNQDSVGWCYAFTSADLMSAELGVPVSGMHVSSIYNRFILKDKGFRDEINNDRIANPENYNFSEVFESGRVQLAVNEAVKNGWLCTEKGLPFDKQKPEQILEMVRALEALKPNIIMNQLDKKTVCREITNIVSPFQLMASDVNQLAESLMEDNLNQTMGLFAEKACGEQIKNLPPMTVKIVHKGNDLEQFMKEVNFNIAKGRLQTVDYDVEPFIGSRGFHSSIIIGRRWNNGQCEYNIRNSWGKSCASYKKGIDCNKEQGTFWVSDEQLFQASANIRYLSN